MSERREHHTSPRGPEDAPLETSSANGSTATIDARSQDTADAGGARDGFRTITVPRHGPVLRAILSHRLQENFDALAASSRLSPKERAVLIAAFHGARTRDIARHVGVQPGTVVTFRKRILQKTGAESIALLLLDLLKRSWGVGDTTLDLE